MKKSFHSKLTHYWLILNILYGFCIWKKISPNDDLLNNSFDVNLSFFVLGIVLLNSALSLLSNRHNQIFLSYLINSGTLFILVVVTFQFLLGQ